MVQYVRVVRSPQGGWCVQLEGAERASSDHLTQIEAIAEGRRLARNEKSMLLIYSRNGDVRERYSYGDDLRSTRYR